MLWRDLAIVESLFLVVFFVEKSEFHLEITFVKLIIIRAVCVGWIAQMQPARQITFAMQNKKAAVTDSGSESGQDKNRIVVLLALLEFRCFAMPESIFETIFL